MQAGRPQAELTGARRDADIAKVPLDSGTRIRHGAARAPGIRGCWRTGRGV